MADPNANPKALRMLADLILQGVQFQQIAVAESLRLCGDAWEADQRRLGPELDYNKLADELGKAQAEVEGLRGIDWDAFEAGLLGTYAGGYTRSDNQQMLPAFQHGMRTAVESMRRRWAALAAAGKEESHGAG